MVMLKIVGSHRQKPTTSTLKLNSEASMLDYIILNYIIVCYIIVCYILLCYSHLRT